MNRQLLARNVLIHRQLSELATALHSAAIPVVILKGAALVECFPSYAGDRAMDDIDILLRPPNISAARETLVSIGYTPLKSDPWAFTHGAHPAAVDISDGLWYMNKRENETLFRECANYPLAHLSPSAFHLPPDEFYLHVLAHAAIHHAKKETKWQNDLNLLRSNWKSETAAETLRHKLDAYGLNEAMAWFTPKHSRARPLTARLYRLITTKDIPQKGHILRFLLLPTPKKTAYLIRTLFPSTAFIKYRYNLKTPTAIAAYRLARPLLLALRGRS